MRQILSLQLYKHFYYVEVSNDVHPSKLRLKRMTKSNDHKLLYVIIIATKTYLHPNDTGTGLKHGDGVMGMGFRHGDGVILL